MLSLQTFAELIVAPNRRTTGYTAVFRHLGAFGLFLIAIVDSSPLPTFGGPDILTIILAARHGEPWFYYSTMATLGSVLGAYLTYRLARGTGSAYLQKKFGERRFAAILQYFERWGTGALVLSTLVPFPFPTSAFFAAAGVLDYPLYRFIAVVALARLTRYSVLGALASHYGGHVARVFRHPGQYIGWLLLVAALVFVLVGAALFVQRHLSSPQGEVSTRN